MKPLGILALDWKATPNVEPSVPHWTFTVFWSRNVRHVHWDTTALAPYVTGHCDSPRAAPSPAPSVSVPRIRLGDETTAAEPLGIAKGEGFHQLRHFYASLLIDSGQSVKSIQERLGTGRPSSPSTFMAISGPKVRTSQELPWTGLSRIYAHVPRTDNPSP
jgi:hypothetical protein